MVRNMSEKVQPTTTTA